MERVNLQEGWRFAKANSNEWTPVSVPGTVLSGLLEAGKMQDPYYRENGSFAAADRDFCNRKGWHY